MWEFPVGEVWPASRGWRISFQEAAICLHRCADMVYVGDIVVGDCCCCLCPRVGSCVLCVGWYNAFVQCSAVSDRCSQSVDSSNTEDNFESPEALWEVIKMRRMAETSWYGQETDRM